VTRDQEGGRRVKKSFAVLTASISLILTSCSTPVTARVASQADEAKSSIQRITLHSPALRKNMRVDVYLPPHYDSHKKYPVLYVFHGKDGTADSWMNGPGGTNTVGIDSDATQLITTNKIHPLIIVSPELDNSYGMNTSDATMSVRGYSRGRYEDYVVKDLVPYIDQHYSTLASREGRYVGGLSMGGFVALHDSFLHPDLFSKVGVMSAALWVGGPPEVLSWLYPTQTLQAQRDPITLAQHGVTAQLPICIIEGDSDPFVNSDRYLYNTLKQHGDDVAYHQYPGSHNYAFWSGHASELLMFFDAVNPV
jgi:enterochelin esterase-like enzyme